jgi:hypothetical protein
VTIANLVIRKSERESNPYSLVVIDPTYKMLGDWDENKVGP